MDCYDFGNDIYACRGIFSGGMEDNSTKSLCNVNDGYHICESAIEAAYLGLTYSVCNSIPTNEVYFIQETSGGGAQCYSQYPLTGNKEDGPRNDIWGCGGYFCGGGSSCYGLLPNFCNSFRPQSGLDFGSDSNNEYDYISITNSSRGGVVCCPPYTLSPTTIPSIPTTVPSFMPTSIPTETPSNNPTSAPTGHPSIVPSGLPSPDPSSFPSGVPTSLPSKQPSTIPSGVPSYPTSQPTNSPTTEPTPNPTTVVYVSNDESNSGPSSDVMGILIAMAVACVVLLCLLVVVIYFFLGHRKKSSERYKKQVVVMTAGNEIGTGAIPRRATNDIQAIGIGIGTERIHRGNTNDLVNGMLGRGATDGYNINDVSTPASQDIIMSDLNFNNDGEGAGTHKSVEDGDIDIAMEGEIGTGAHVHAGGVGINNTGGGGSDIDNIDGVAEVAVAVAAEGGGGNISGARYHMMRNWQSWSIDELANWLENEILKSYGEYEEEDKIELQKFVQPFRNARITADMVYHCKQINNWENIRNAIASNRHEKVKLFGLFLTIETAFQSLPNDHKNNDNNGKRHGNTNGGGNDQVELELEAIDSVAIRAAIPPKMEQSDAESMVNMSDGLAMEDAVMDDILNHMETAK